MQRRVRLSGMQLGAFLSRSDSGSLPAGVVADTEHGWLVHGEPIDQVKFYELSDPDGGHCDLCECSDKWQIVCDPDCTGGGCTDGGCHEVSDVPGGIDLSSLPECGGDPTRTD